MRLNLNNRRGTNLIYRRGSHRTGRSRKELFRGNHYKDRSRQELFHNNINHLLGDIHADPCHRLIICLSSRFNSSQARYTSLGDPRSRFIRNQDKANRRSRFISNQDKANRCSRYPCLLCMLAMGTAPR